MELKTDQCIAESFDRKGLLKVNSQNLGMRFKIGNEMSSYNFSKKYLPKMKLSDKNLCRNQI